MSHAYYQGQQVLYALVTSVVCLSPPPPPRQHKITRKGAHPSEPPTATPGKTTEYYLRQVPSSIAYTITILVELAMLVAVAV